jgi:hypothetical protein
MSRHLIGILFAVAFTGIGHAQVLPGDPVDTGIGAAVRNSPSKPLFGLSRDRQQYIYDNDNPSPGLRAPPPKKGSNDPWKGLRKADPAESYDRHRPY